MKTTCILTRQEKLDILTTAIESNGIQYWAFEESGEKITITRDHEGNITKAIITMPHPSDEGSTKQYIVTPAVVQKGVNVLLSAGFQVGDYIKRTIITGEFDQENSDCIIQAALFGELVYG